MTSLLKHSLATALDAHADDIMEWKENEDGSYTVLFYSYQKFTNVIPTQSELVEDYPTDTPPPEPVEGDPADGSAGSPTAEPVVGPTAELTIPDHLERAFEKPQHSNRAQLRRLCDLLQIPYTSKTRKTQLVKAINDWKSGRGASRSAPNGG